MATKTKVDFKKTWKHLYAPSAKAFAVVEVPPLAYLMVDGHGDPNTAVAYTEAVETLYAVAYKAKFLSKKELGRDYVVPPLEGLWWAEDMDHYTVKRDKSQWYWTMMIMQPDWLTAEHIATAKEVAAQKKELPALSKLRFACYEEGLAAQIMHIGSYDDETPTLARLHREWLPQNGYVENGKHHEIYLSDPRRVTPEKLKTILRQPIRPATTTDSLGLWLTPQNSSKSH
ncbi:MAG: GyrI-like domain-containing protein [Anaerolineales bacterium]|nr:GyrI-like domain-containing protein [Anaerolineales bacterium]